MGGSSEVWGTPWLQVPAPAAGPAQAFHALPALAGCEAAGRGGVAAVLAAVMAAVLAVVLTGQLPLQWP